jgi:hypothetical protein
MIKNATFSWVLERGFFGVNILQGRSKPQSVCCLCCKSVSVLLATTIVRVSY